MINHKRTLRVRFFLHHPLVAKYLEMKLEKLDTESFEVEKFFTRIDQTLSSHYQKGWVDQISTDPSAHSYLLVMYQDMVDKSLDGTLCISNPYCFTTKQFFLCHLILSEETTDQGRTPACIKILYVHITQQVSQLQRSLSAEKIPAELEVQRIT